MRRTLRDPIISLALVDGHSFTREAIAKSLQATCHFLKIVPFATVDECVASTVSYSLILYRAHEGYGNTCHAENKYSCIRELVTIGPTVVLSDLDSLESIQAAFDSGVRGYIPTGSTTLEMAVGIISLVNVGGTFFPASSLTSGKAALPTRYTTGDPPRFTPRQQAVLERLRMGKTNKIIAYELQMSPSSVKTHVRNIMRKMNATNRTEVACRAHEFELNTPLRLSVRLDPARC